MAVETKNTCSFSYWWFAWDQLLVRAINCNRPFPMVSASWGVHVRAPQLRDWWGKQRASHKGRSWAGSLSIGAGAFHILEKVDLPIQWGMNPGKYGQWELILWFHQTHFEFKQVSNGFVWVVIDFCWFISGLKPSFMVYGPCGRCLPQMVGIGFPTSLHFMASSYRAYDDKPISSWGCHSFNMFQHVSTCFKQSRKRATKLIHLFRRLQLIQQLWSRSTKPLSDHQVGEPTGLASSIGVCFSSNFVATF